MPKESVFGNNTSADLLALAARMTEGEILIREKKLDPGLAELREAIKIEDALKYDEPPGWLIPVRHSLGATLLQNGRFAEAERVYREDLKRLPANGWSLYGLAESLRAQKKDPAKRKRPRPNLRKYGPKPTRGLPAPVSVSPAKCRTKATFNTRKAPAVSYMV